MKGLALDASLIVSHLRKRLAIWERVDGGDLLFITLTVLGELQVGIRRNPDPVGEQTSLDFFPEDIAILQPDEATATTYGKIAAKLQRQGRMIPTNDIWIAAAALECGLTVATQDPHFQRVEGLEVWLWE